MVWRMIKSTVAIAFIAMSLSTAPTSVTAEEEERLADISALLTVYRCMEKGTYHYGSPVVTKVSLGEFSDGISQIKGMKNLLDTPEEFITAAYYSYMDVMNEMKVVIQKELPPGRTGALRVASMWLKKCAENRGSCEKYGAAIDLIKEKSAVSEQSIHDYFGKAIENEVRKLAAAQCPAGMTQKGVYDEICRPIIAYYNLPDNATEKNLVIAGVKLFNENGRKAEVFSSVIFKLNANFAAVIINKIHEKRSQGTGR